MAKRLGTYKGGELIADGMLMLKSFGAEEDSPELWMRLLNRKVSEFHALASLKNSEEYRERVALSGVN